MFVNVITLAHCYARKLYSQPQIGDVEVIGEVVLRLRQLHWLYHRIEELESTLIAAYQRDHGPLRPGHNVVLAFLNRGLPADADVPLQPQEELRLLGDSFYHSAHGILTILDQCQHLLPGLRHIDARGIRRVRNNLVEHANKKGGHASYTFSVSNAAGLRLRTVARAGDPDGYLDEGIHANAREFITQLEHLLGSNAA